MKREFAETNAPSYRVVINVIHETTYRGLFGPVLHIVTLSYVPAGGESPTPKWTSEDALKDAITKLSSVYETYESFQIKSAPFAGVEGAETLSTSFRVKTPEKMASDEQRAAGFSEQLVAEIDEMKKKNFAGLGVNDVDFNTYMKMIVKDTQVSKKPDVGV